MESIFNRFFLSFAFLVLIAGINLPAFANPKIPVGKKCIFTANSSSYLLQEGAEYEINGMGSLTFKTATSGTMETISTALYKDIKDDLRDLSRFHCPKQDDNSTCISGIRNIEFNLTSFATKTINAQKMSDAASSHTFSDFYRLNLFIDNVKSDELLILAPANNGNTIFFLDASLAQSGVCQVQ
jgi:hypothetical protein